jgi:hypothetical protein
MPGEQQAPLGVGAVQEQGAPAQQGQQGGELSQLLEGVAMGIAKLQELSQDPNMPPEMKDQIMQILSSAQQQQPLQQTPMQSGPNSQPSL